uniref:HGWP repeat containing protein-like n=1 Tax=Oryza sativa subsp. japonica TaxID=39947 RepID=Q5VMW6_ORYSJ|nr:HGWP repeat containing protein-like [Oryza sativa Japonica Group]
MLSSMKEVGRKVIDKQKHALHRSRKTPDCNCPATVTLSLSKQDDLGKSVSMKAKSEIFHSVSDATRSEKCKHRLPGNATSWEMIQRERTHQDMNHEKFWNGSITELPQPSLSQPKGASWSKSGEEKIPSATGGQAKQFRVHLLSAVAAVLRLAAAAAPLLLPTRRHLPRHRRIAVDLVRASVSLADRRSTVVIVIPSRAAVSLRSGRRSRRRRCPGTPQLRKIRSSWKLKPSFGKASK